MFYAIFLLSQSLRVTEVGFNKQSRQVEFTIEGFIDPVLWIDENGDVQKEENPRYDWLYLQYAQGKCYLHPRFIECHKQIKQIIYQHANKAY